MDETCMVEAGSDDGECIEAFSGKEDGIEKIKGICTGILNN